MQQYGWVKALGMAEEKTGEPDREKQSEKQVKGLEMLGGEEKATLRSAWNKEN